MENISLIKLIWINILAILIALTSVVSDIRGVDFHFDQMTSIQQVPSCSSECLRNPYENLSQGNHFIAEGFIQIVLISDHSEPQLEQVTQSEIEFSKSKELVACETYKLKTGGENLFLFNLREDFRS